MVLRLADRLDVPLRERNRWLAAAGYAPMFAERRLDDPALAAGRAAVELVLKAHEPWPALAVDRHWAMVAHNAVVPLLIEGCRRRAAAAAGERAAPEPASRGPGAAHRQPARMARPPALPPRPADRGQRRRGAGSAARGAEPLSAARDRPGRAARRRQRRGRAAGARQPRSAGSPSSARRRCSARRTTSCSRSWRSRPSSRPTRRRRPRCEGQAEGSAAERGRGRGERRAPWATNCAASGTERVLPLQRAPCVRRPGQARTTGHAAAAAQGRIARWAKAAATCSRWAKRRRQRASYSRSKVACAVGRASRVRPADAAPATSKAASTKADCSAMLMPSPTIGWASPAALPTRKMPSPCPSRTPGRIGPVASQGPSRAAPSQRRGDAGALAAQDRLEHVAGALAGIAPRGRGRAGLRGCSRRAWRCRRRRRPCRRSRRRTRAPAAGRARSRPATKVRLEGEQVAGPALLAAHRALRRQRLPRAVGGDDQRRLDGGLGIRPRRPRAGADGKSRPRPRSPAARRAGTGSRRPARPGGRARCRAALARAPGRSADPARRPAAAARPRSRRRACSATRRSSAPARRSTSAPTPSASSSARLLAAMHSPQTLRRGKRCRSISATDQPARASRIAAARRPGRRRRSRRRSAASSLIDPGRRSSVAQKQWVKRPSSYSSSCQALGGAGGSPGGGPACQASLSSLVDEAGAHAEHAVAPRHRVRAEEEDQVRGAEREAAAPRLAGGERVGAAGAAGEQATQIVAVEVMEEQVGDDQVPVLGRVAIGRPVEHVGDPRPRLPAGRGVGGDRLGIDDRLAIEQVELDARASARLGAGPPRASAGRRRSRSRGCAAAGRRRRRSRRSRRAPCRARARGCGARP